MNAGLDGACSVVRLRGMLRYRSCAAIGGSFLVMALAACGGTSTPASSTATHASSTTPTVSGSAPAVERVDISGIPVKKVRPLAVVASGFEFVTRLSVAGGKVWASSADGLAVVDATTNKTRLINKLTAHTNYGLGRVLVTNSFERNVIARYDVKTGKRLWQVHQDSPSGVAIEGDHLWISNYTQGTVTIADAASGKTTATVTVSPPNDNGLSQPLLVGDKVWVRNNATNEIIAIDVKTHVVGPSVKLPESMQFCPTVGMAAAGSMLWAPDCTTLLVRIDTRTGTAAVVDLGAKADTPLVLDSGVWVPVWNRFVHIDNAARPDRAVEVNGTKYVFQSVYADGALWANEGFGTLARLPAPNRW